MRFTTLSFLIFFITFYLIYWKTRGRARLGLIVLGSVLFYAAWSVSFALHFVAIVVLNFFLIRRLLQRPSRALFLLILGLDFGNLFLFKYFYLFLRALRDSLLGLDSALGGPLGLAQSGLAFFLPEQFNPWLESWSGATSIILPLAISFYTFQLVAYAADVYRGEIKEKDGFLEFTTFILFFPQLVAGPIMRRSDFLYQLRDIRPDENKTQSGMTLLLLGVLKKVIIADNIHAVIHPVFQNPQNYDWTTNLMAAIGFTARVYCGFSGYTDIARGLGKLLGLELPENFRAPYLSRSFRETWNRWHITLSTWIRDYLYIPLGGSRRGPIRNFLNIVVSFTLAGLWHGANYTFLVWGFLHGLLLALEREARRLRERAAPRLARRGGIFQALFGALPSGSAWATLRSLPAFAFVFSAWTILALIFNAPDIERAWIMLGSIFTGAESAVLRSEEEARLIARNNMYLFWMFVLALFFNFLQTWKKRPFDSWKPAARYAAIGLGTILLMFLLGRYSPQGVDFIYFQF